LLGNVPRKHSLNWEASYERLRLARENIEATFDPPPAELQRRLHLRALVLAKPAAVVRPAELVDLVVFNLGSGSFAMAATEAHEVLPVSLVTMLPGVPSFYYGLINHGGNIYPLVDLRPLLGISAGSDTPPAHAIVAVGNAFMLALAADSIETFIQMDKSLISTASADDVTVHPAVRGAFGDSTVVIDVKVLLQDARLVVDYRPQVTENDGALP
jgi:chemotaxis signal transduction protein